MLNNKLVQNSAHWSSSFTKLNLTVDELKASNSKLEKELAKERDDRKVETDRLEERLEEQDQLHTTRLAEEKATRSRDVQSITEV